MARKAKKFDCVAMKRAAQRKIRARVRGLTPKQEIAFFRAGSAKFAAALNAARRAAQGTGATSTTSGGGRRTTKRAAP